MKTIGVYSSQFELVSGLVNNNILKNPNAVAAMKSVDRKNYCATSPYEDTPRPTILGQTISAPHMHADVLEMLAPSIMVRRCTLLAC